MTDPSVLDAVERETSSARSCQSRAQEHARKVRAKLERAHYTSVRACIAWLHARADEMNKSPLPRTRRREQAG